MKIAIDAMGGDYAPENPVAGGVLAARELGVGIILVGYEDRIKTELEKHDISGLDIEIAHAEEHIDMEDSTADAARSKRNSSMHVSARLVKKGDAQAVVSAGHTGASMAVSKIVLGSIKGVKRPALALAVPTVTRQPAIFLDVGANVTCTSEHLVQFAIMGNTYAKDVFGVESPRVGVLSNGEEATKGNEVVKKTVERLGKTNLNFIGPVEGRDLFNGEADVIVTDGFTGNAVLKAAESIAELTFKLLKEEIMSSWKNRLAALLLKSSFRNLKQRFDYSEYGGAPLLGINGVGIVCHGRSNPEAIKNAAVVARDFHNHRANAHIERGIRELYREQIL